MTSLPHFPVHNHNVIGVEPLLKIEQKRNYYITMYSSCIIIYAYRELTFCPKNKTKLEAQVKLWLIEGASDLAIFNLIVNNRVKFWLNFNDSNTEHVECCIYQLFV